MMDARTNPELLRAPPLVKVRALPAGYAERMMALKFKAAAKDFALYRRLRHPEMIWGWWNEEVARELQAFYNQMMAGERPKLVLTAPPQTGKLVADDTPVLTGRGWSTHGALRVGDTVFHPSGKPIKVRAVSSKAPARCRVELSNGDVIWCHERHEWTVLQRFRHGARLRTIETQQLMRERLSDGQSAIGKRGRHFLFHLPRVAPLTGTKQRLPVKAYVLGAWLGHGTRCKPVVVQGIGDEQVVAAIEQLGYPVSARHKHPDGSSVAYTFSVSGRSLQLGLKQLGFMRKKCKQFIPDQYLVAPLKDRLQLLAGLIDTGGSVYHPNGRVYICTAEPELMRSLVRLLASFGWHASVDRVPARASTTIPRLVGRKDCYYIAFSPTLPIPCRLPRKRLRRVFEKTKPVAIKSIKRVSSKRKGHCITVDAPDGLYLVGDTLQPTHNSWTVWDFVAWIAGKQPSLKTIFGSYSEDLGVACNRDLERTVKSEVYRKIFPKLRIDEPGWTCTTNLIEYVDYRGSFRNTTVNGKINGMALDLGIIDDPVKGRNEAFSKNTRDKTWNWFADDFRPRFSATAGLLIIMTRWSIDDLVGRFVAKFGSDVRLLKYPAIAEVDSEHTFKGRKFTRLKGTALFPEHKPLDFLLDQRKLMTEGSWESEYQQNPIIVGGGALPVERLVVMSPIFSRSDVVASCRYWDKAGTTDDGAFTAGVLMHKLKDGRYVIEHIERGQWSALDREERIRGIARADALICPNIEIVVEQEPGSGGKESAEATIRGLPGHRVYADKVTGKKEVRAEPFVAQVQGGNVLLGPGPGHGNWVRNFLDEAEPWPYGKYKDQVDAAAGAFNRLATGTSYNTDYKAWAY